MNLNRLDERSKNRTFCGSETSNEVSFLQNKVEIDLLDSLIEPYREKPLEVPDGVFEEGEWEIEHQVQEEESVTEVEVELSNEELVRMVDEVLNKNPSFVLLIAKGLPKFYALVEKYLEAYFGLKVDLVGYRNEDFEFFIKAVGLGVIAGVGYYNAIRSSFKTIYYYKEVREDLNVRSSNLGLLYKSYPVLSFMTKQEFNILFERFWGRSRSIVCEDGDYASYFMSFFNDKPVYDRLDEIDVVPYTNMEIAELIMGGNRGVAELAKKQLSKGRLNNLVILLKAMREKV